MRHPYLRRAALIGALSVLPLVAAAPASADVPIGGGAVSANSCNGLHCWSGVLTANVQPIGNTGLALVAWNCQATGTFDPTSTTISTCTVGGQHAAPLTLPGPYVATAATSIFVIGSSVPACVGGQSLFAENVLGNQLVAASNCQPLVIARIPL